MLCKTLPILPYETSVQVQYEDFVLDVSYSKNYTTRRLLNTIAL